MPKSYKAPVFLEQLVAGLSDQGTVSLECKVIVIIITIIIITIIIIGTVLPLGLTFSSSLKNQQGHFQISRLHFQIRLISDMDDFKGSWDSIASPEVVPRWRRDQVLNITLLLLFLILFFDLILILLLLIIIIITIA